MDATDVGWLRERASAEGMTRSRLSVELCNRKEWRDGLGRSRAMAGRVAISRAAREYEIALPAAQRIVPAYRRPKTLNLETAVAGLNTAHLPKITLAFEFSVTSA